MRVRIRQSLFVSLVLGALAACDDGTNPDPQQPLDPADASRVMIDRFSDDAATLFRRSEGAPVPAAGIPIDFDAAPFITRGLGPVGQEVLYYNFDIQPTAPAPIWVLFREGSGSPVPGQLNIIDVIPGDAGYNDFWRVIRVTVPADYVANTAASVQDIVDAGYAVEETDILVNCPVVPEGSTATEGPGANGLVQGWYDDQAVFYFDFNEAPLAVTPSDAVPTSPIFVTFEIDPDEPGGGPLSGFRTQGSSDLTHNVLATLPGDAGYSPLWDVIPYDNTSFDGVWNLDTAADAPDFGVAGQVNCPVVFVGEAPGDPSTATRTVVDRFSDNAGMLFRRSVDPSLPAAGTAVDFDAEPFITTGFGPDGEVASYYNFDVMSADPAPIHAFFFESGDPVPNQLNVVGVVPGDVGYNDFWRLVRVTVPDDYIANSATSVQDISTAGLDTEVTDILVNCPIVPGGSTADLRLGGEDPGLVQGWAAGEIVHYFNFGEAPLSVTAQDEVPTSAIYVTFNVNPDQPGGGPPSGFMVEGGTWQTHNVLEKLPGDVGYSPLWAVFPYDNASFGTVVDLATAQAATSFGFAALVNCPVVELP